MLIEKIKEFVDSYNEPAPAEPLFHFAYGKDHWQNLCDHAKDDNKPFEERNKYFKLLYVDRDYKTNEHSALIRIVYDGEMFVGASSMVSDKSYEYKYETHIKNCLQLVKQFAEDLLDCDNFYITNWKVVEVENLYDNNLDGVKVKFSIYKDV